MVHQPPHMFLKLLQLIAGSVIKSILIIRRQTLLSHRVAGRTLKAQRNLSMSDWESQRSVSTSGAAPPQHHISHSSAAGLLGKI